MHVKKFRQQCNGRGAYFALKNFLLGKDHVSRMVREMEANLKGFVYRGKGRRYGFAKYRTNHVEQHDIAESLVEFGYPGLSQDQKVTYFLDGIKTSALEVVKATVRVTANLKSEFNACATYIQDAINAAPPATEASGQGGMRVACPRWVQDNAGGRPGPRQRSTPQSLPSAPSMSEGGIVSTSPPRPTRP